MADYYRIRNSVIKKSDIVLIERSGNEYSGYKLKFILKGGYDLDFDYELYSELEYDLDIMESGNYVCINEVDLDDDFIVSVTYINKDYLASVYFEEKYLCKNVVVASFLLTDGLDDIYPIITNFKSIDEGVKAIG